MEELLKRTLKQHVAKRPAPQVEIERLQQRRIRAHQMQRFGAAATALALLAILVVPNPIEAAAKKKLLMTYQEAKAAGFGYEAGTSKKLPSDKPVLTKVDPSSLGARAVTLSHLPQGFTLDHVRANDHEAVWFYKGSQESSITLRVSEDDKVAIAVAEHTLYKELTGPKKAEAVMYILKAAPDLLRVRWHGEGPVGVRNFELLGRNVSEEQLTQVLQGINW